MTELAIRVDNLGQQYRIGGKRERYGRFTETLMDTFTAPFRRAKQALQRAHDLIWALRDVSFEVQRARWWASSGATALSWA